MSATDRLPCLRLLLAVVLIAPALAAHEMSFQSATVEFRRDRSVHVAIEVDPAFLLMPVSASEPHDDLRRAFAALDPAERAARIERVHRLFADNIVLRCDGRPLASAVRIVGTDAIDDPYDQQLEGVVLTAAIPDGAATFTWTSTSHIGPTILLLHRQGESERTTQAVGSDATSEPFPLQAQAPAASPLLQFLGLGFRHIVPDGLDHILFVLGLFLLSPRMKPLLTQVTCFTVAHSLTLGLAWFGVLHVSARLIEPAITLSIMAVAIENVLTARLTPWRPLVVTGFGLIHGLGFADVLLARHLAHGEIVTGLVGFNLGVELGQLAVIALAWLLTDLLRERPWYRQRVVIPASLAIAVTGLVWTVLRLMG